MPAPRFQRVAVLMGGVSNERPISIQSGEAVVRGLRDAGYRAEPVLLDREALPPLEGIEAVFIALHGRFGEDGGVQRLLDARGVPYTGAGAEASRVAFDKILTRAVLAAAGCPVAPGQTLGVREPVSAVTLPLPLVVKPPREGSSLGITIVRAEGELAPAVAEGRRYADELLIEAFIPGREWTVGIVDGEALPPIEIEAALDGGWYSWRAKYFSAGTTRYLFPEDHPGEAALCRRCRELALEVSRALGVRGMARVDFRVPPQGDPVVLELNTIPGFTGTSLLPKAAARAGLSFAALCARLLETAACDPCTGGGC